MPTVSQVGTPYNGSYGFPIQFTLIDQDNNPINLAGVTTITLTLIRPELTQLIVNLSLGSITNVSSGVLQYTVRQGDLTFGGEYKYTIGLQYGSSALLNIGGSFKVLTAART